MTGRGGEAKPLGLVAAGLIGNRLSRKTRAKLERGDNPRSGQPVWRNSYTEGQCENRIWRRYGDGSKRTGRRLHGLIMKSARRFERESRRARQAQAELARKMNSDEAANARLAGKPLHRKARRGLLGDVGLEVLDFLWGRVDYLTGRLEPAIGTIADEIGRSYSAVHRALKDLRARGYLQWERRSRPIEKAAPGERQVEQIPNAYVLLIPKALRAFFSIEIGGARPAPACVAWDREEAKRDFDRMLSQLTAQEFHRATWEGDTRAGETLAAIARMVDDRESSISRETGGELHSP